MQTKRRPLPDFLTKPINLANAPARGLRQVFCAQPDKSDVKAYAFGELNRRLKMFDQECGLGPNAQDLPERRVKAIVEMLFKIPADAPDWWAKLSWTLMSEFVPAFSISNRCRPRTWTFAAYIDLHGDVTATKRRYPDLRGKNLYEALRRRNPRWARHGIPALRRAHVEAKARIRHLLGAAATLAN